MKVGGKKLLEGKQEGKMVRDKAKESARLIKMTICTVYFTHRKIETHDSKISCIAEWGGIC